MLTINNGEVSCFTHTWKKKGYLSIFHLYRQNFANNTIKSKTSSDSKSFVSPIGQNLHVESCLSHLYTIFSNISQNCHISKTGLEYFQFVHYRRYISHHLWFLFFLTLCLLREYYELYIAETISISLHIFFGLCKMWYCN